jgi:hypothetical protein
MEDGGVGGKGEDDEGFGGISSRGLVISSGKMNLEWEYLLGG